MVMEVHSGSLQQSMQDWPSPNGAEVMQFQSSFPPASTSPSQRVRNSIQSSVRPSATLNRSSSSSRNGSQKRRACNECRQQKLRCDLGTLAQPADACTRCARLGYECRIDELFKRERKRKRSDELEKELEQLKQQISTQSDGHVSAGERSGGELHEMRHKNRLSARNGDVASLSPSSDPPRVSMAFATTRPNMTSPESAHSHASHPPGTTTRPYPEGENPDANVPNIFAYSTTNAGRRPSRALGNIELSADCIDNLFGEYFAHYHQYLPMLDPSLDPVKYFETSSLLFWCIVSVAARRCEADPTLLTRLARSVTNLTWKTLQSIPHSKSVVQSLVLLCTWPFPTSSSTADVSFMWAGMMMQISIQMGLHRPMNPQDFTKFPINLSEIEVKERIRTWAACNITAQRVSIGSGLASPAQYDWALVFASQSDSSDLRLDASFSLHLKIEMFRDHVSRSMASNVSDPQGLPPTQERLLLYKLFAKELECIEASGGELSPITRFYIIAARLHLQSFFIFDEPTSETYTERMLTLYFTAISLIQHTIETDKIIDGFLRHCPFFVYQTFVSASFFLLKVLRNDFFSAFLDIESGRKLFHASVGAIRKMSVANNDLPGRLGDVLAFLWTDTNPNLISGTGQNGLQLKIRSRLSMSVVYDSLWRWREQFRSQTEPDQADDEDYDQGSTREESLLQPITLDQQTGFAPSSVFFDSFGSLDFALDPANFSLAG